MDGHQSDELDEVKLKKLISTLEKKMSVNQKLRIKYADDPAKFSISETELFSAMDELQSVSTQPKLYNVLVEKGTCKKLITLISHENTDISGKSIEIIKELTDIEDLYGSGALNPIDNLMYDGLSANEIFSELVANLKRLDESVKEEAQIINDSLAIVDHMNDYDSVFAKYSFRESCLGEWMLEQIKKSPRFNSIKLAIGELLAICVCEPHCTPHFGEIGGFDVVLKQIAYYRRNAPKSVEEHEYLEQLINCLCRAQLGEEDNREKFVEEEGIDLIVLILREKRDAVKKSLLKFGMIKIMYTIVSFGTEDPIVTKCCERFIEVLGLKAIFPIFNDPKLVLSERIKKKEQYQLFISEVEENTSGILIALLKYCKNPEYTQRILVKFAESNFEKFNRLIELHDKYFTTVSQMRDEFEAKNPNPTTDWYDGDNSKSRMLFILRSADYMILLTSYLGNKFETYDPNSGETFTNKVCKLVSERPELRNQIVMESQQHADEVNEAKQEQDSISFLLDYFKKISLKPASLSTG